MCISKNSKNFPYYTMLQTTSFPFPVRISGYRNILLPVLLLGCGFAFVRWILYFIWKKIIIVLLFCATVSLDWATVSLPNVAKFSMNVIKVYLYKNLYGILSLLLEELGLILRVKLFWKNNIAREEGGLFCP